MVKKYLSLERLTEYDALIKAEIVESDATTLSSAKSHSNTNLDVAKTYTDTAVAKKSAVQIIKWEAND